MEHNSDAITVLNRQVASYPNINFVNNHVLLGISYIEIGQEQKARAEAAEIRRISPHYSLEAWPQRNPAPDKLKERWLLDLRKAGLN